MTAEKAIEILDIIRGGDFEHEYKDVYDAIGLGKEALKQLLDYREFDGDLALHLLPGETLLEEPEDEGCG